MYQPVAALNQHNATEVAQAGAQAIAQGQTRFDLAALGAVDSAAVSVLLDWQRNAARLGKTLEFTGIPESLQSLIALYGLSEQFGLANGPAHK